MQTTLDDLEVEARGSGANGPSDRVAPGFNFEREHHKGSPEAQRFGDLGGPSLMTFSGRAPDKNPDANAELMDIVTHTGVGTGTRSLLQDSGFPAQDGSQSVVLMLGYDGYRGLSERPHGGMPPGHAAPSPERQRSSRMA